MNRLIYSEQSLSDLGSIIDFIARGKPDAAIAFAEELIRTCELIGNNSEMG